MYNNPDLDVVVMGKTLQKFYLSKVAKLPKEEFALHEDDLVANNEEDSEESDDSSDEEFAIWRKSSNGDVDVVYCQLSQSVPVCVENE